MAEKSRLKFCDEQEKHVILVREAIELVIEQFLVHHVENEYAKKIFNETVTDWAKICKLPEELLQDSEKVSALFKAKNKECNSWTFWGKSCECKQWADCSKDMQENIISMVNELEHYVNTPLSAEKAMKLLKPPSKNT